MFVVSRTRIPVLHVESILLHILQTPGQVNLASLKKPSRQEIDLARRWSHVRSRGWRKTETEHPGLRVARGELQLRVAEPRFVNTVIESETGIQRRRPRRWWLHSRMTTTDDPLPDLIRALRSRVVADRTRAAKDLGRLGWLAREALPALVRALEDEEGKVREAAAHAIGQMGPEALPTLSSMLTHSDKYVRRNAIWALGKLGPLARASLQDVCRSLKDPDPRTASGAAQALGNMGADGDDAIPYLTEAMRGTNIVLCRLAAKALSQIGPSALATLIAHLQHSDPFVRGESALALGWMGPTARSSVPFLAQLVRGKQSFPLSATPPPTGMLTREAVLGEAEQIENDLDQGSGLVTPTAAPVSEEVATEDTCRVYAAQALGRMGPAAIEAISDLRVAARYGPDPLRQAAKQALRQIQAG